MPDALEISKAGDGGGGFRIAGTSHCIFWNFFRRDLRTGELAGAKGNGSQFHIMSLMQGIVRSKRNRAGMLMEFRCGGFPSPQEALEMDRRGSLPRFALELHVV